MAVVVLVDGVLVDVLLVVDVVLVDVVLVELVVDVVLVGGAVVLVVDVLVVDVLVVDVVVTGGVVVVTMGAVVGATCDSWTVTVAAQPEVTSANAAIADATSGVAAIREDRPPAVISAGNRIRNR